MVAAGPLLALETSTAAGSVAVGRAGRILAEVSLGLPGQQSVALMPAVDAALRWAGLVPGDLAGVVVSGGPGSFTGVRIGAATAKGVVAALDLPLWSYSGLAAAAAGCVVPHPGREVRVCGVFDARRRDVFAACYVFGVSDGRPSVREQFAPEALSLDELIGRFRGGEPPLFAGDAALLHAAELAASLRAPVAPAHLAFPRAAALLWLAEVAPELGRLASAAEWEPEYVRAAGAERIAAARAADA